MSVELLAVCERFDLESPLPPIGSIEQLADLIAAKKQLQNGTTTPTWHDAIQNVAIEILNDSHNGFSKHSVHSNSIPKKLARMKFANLFEKRTGLRTRFQRIPHAAYFGLAPMIAGLLFLNQSVYPLIVFGIISIFAFIRIWAHFTSRDCTTAEFANLVISDNLDDRSNLTHQDILCYLRTKFPLGIKPQKSGG